MLSIGCEPCDFFNYKFVSALKEKCEELSGSKKKSSESEQEDNGDLSSSQLSEEDR